MVFFITEVIYLHNTSVKNQKILPVGAGLRGHLVQSLLKAALICEYSLMTQVVLSTLQTTKRM